MRILHRYIGFFTIGIMMVYAFSGIVLTYRGTDLFKVEKEFIEDIGPNISAENLANELGFRSLNINKTEDGVIYFDIGNYNTKTGIAKYSWPSYPTWISKMSRLHKTKSSRPLGWLNILSGVLLFFLAFSSFWMYKPKTKNFKRGIIISAIGIIFTVVILMF
ncbi:hypothetical protein [Labilibacter marinus]|uniref:hypothetical protein n=1 Tax=Labilibacter marinus TaxID=1477105 RepID=UPI0018E91196|nr:hypothetical protein [Labilibacter marinus]